MKWDSAILLKLVTVPICWRMGLGKGRAYQNGLAKDSLVWRIVFLSSGEIGLAQHMEDAGKKMKGGQEVRLLEISAQAGPAWDVRDFTRIRRW